MRMGIYAVYNDLMEVYDGFHLERNDKIALLNVRKAFADVDYPIDGFKLVRFGDFDTESGEIDVYEISRKLDLTVLDSDDGGIDGDK